MRCYISLERHGQRRCSKQPRDAKQRGSPPAAAAPPVDHSAVMIVHAVVARILTNHLFFLIMVVGPVPTGGTFLTRTPCVGMLAVCQGTSQNRVSRIPSEVIAHPLSEPRIELVVMAGTNYF